MLSVDRETKCDGCPLKNSPMDCIGQADSWRYICGMTNEKVQCDFIVEESEIWHRHQGKPAVVAQCHPAEPLVEKPRKRNLERELVVAHYKEWIDWVNDSPIPVCLYQKCPSQCTTEFKDHVTVRHLPNKGREAGTYLAHICDNYDSLAEMTYFVQGATHSGVELFGRLAVPYTDTTSLTRHYTPDWPGSNVTDHDLVEWHGGFEVRYGDALYDGDQLPEHNEPWLDRIWRTWFSSPRPEKWWWYGYGAEYFVCRHRILARPLEFWQRARDAVNASPNDLTIWLMDSGSAWAFELMFFYLWGDADRYKVRIPTDEELAISVQAPSRKPGGCGCGAKSTAGKVLSTRNKARKK